MTIKQLAQALRISTCTAQRKLKSGEIKASKVKGKWEIARRDLCDYLKRFNS